MISKLKYYFGPYNQVKGFRKFMELPKGYDSIDLKTSNQLWENVSSYILYDKEGVLKKLPFRLEKYTIPAYPSLIPMENESQKNNKNLKTRNKKQDRKHLVLSESKKIDRNRNTGGEKKNLLLNLCHTKDISSLLSPVELSSASKFSGRNRGIHDRRFNRSWMSYLKEDSDLEPQNLCFSNASTMAASTMVMYKSKTFSKEQKESAFTPSWVRVNGRWLPSTNKKVNSIGRPEIQNEIHSAPKWAHKNSSKQKYLMFAAHGFRLKNFKKSPRENRFPKICAGSDLLRSELNSSCSKGGVNKQAIVPMNQKRRNYRKNRKEIWANFNRSMMNWADSMASIN